MPRHLVGLTRAAVATVAIGLAFAGPMAGVAAAHAMLVSSTPGAGEVVPSAPAELRLVFSEPVDGRYTSVILLDAAGRTVQTGAAVPSAGDPRVVIASLPPLPDGAYSVTWRALSAADGHLTSGFLTFGVGRTVLGTSSVDGAAAGGLHAGHTAGEAVLETQARFLAYLGFMTALGLAVIAWLVLRPVGRLRSGLPIAQGLALIGAAAGSVAIGVVAGLAPGLDPVGYLTATRPGEMLVLRGLLGVAAGAAVLVLVRTRRMGQAVWLGGIAGAAGLVVLALGGHLAASASPVPTGVLLVHLAAGSVWLGGLLGVAWLIVGDRDPDRAWVPEVVSRFSALALVSVALVALTGAYQAWVATRDLVDAAPYTVALWAKVALFVSALAVGAANFVDGGRALARLGGLRARMAIEAILGVAVLVATATLASGSPPANGQPVAISPAASTTCSPGVGLAVQPGTAGPARFIVRLADAPADATVELDLNRTDAVGGGTRVTLREVAGAGSGASTAGGGPAGIPTLVCSIGGTPQDGAQAGGGTWVADGGLLAAESRWDATVVVRRADATEVARARFPFALDSTAISEGRAGPPVDPVAVLGAVGLLLALLAVTFTLAGGILPRTEPRLGRGALLAGAAVAAVLGVALLVGPAS